MFLMILLTAVSCDIYSPDAYYSVTNLSEDSVYFFATYEDSTKCGPIGEMIPAYSHPDALLAPNETCDGLEVWDFNYYKARRLYVFFFRKSTVDNAGWDYLREKDSCDARYDFTLDDLKSINYRIIYRNQ